MKRGKFRPSGRKSFLTVRCMHWSHPAGEALEASSLGVQGPSWRKAASPGKALSKSSLKVNSKACFNYRRLGSEMNSAARNKPAGKRGTPSR